MHAAASSVNPKASDNHNAAALVRVFGIGYGPVEFRHTPLVHSRPLARLAWAGVLTWVGGAREQGRQHTVESLPTFLFFEFYRFFFF